MRRKIYKMICVAVACMSLTACDSWLDVDPSDQYSTETFWKTKEHASAGIMGCYNALKPWRSLHTMEFDMLTANAMPYNEANGTQAIGKGEHLSTTALIGSLWKNCYVGIGRTNTFIANVGGVDMDENKMGWREYARYAEMSVEDLARDCEVQVFRATGPGGQGVNTTDSAVRMKHGPTGITVTARESRSQFQKRASCLRKLRAELERRGRPPRRRVRTKVPQRSRQRRLNDKHFNAIKKANRRKLGSDE